MHSPYQSLLIKFWNATASLSPFTGGAEYDCDRLMNSALKAAKVAGFRDDSFLEPLTELLAALDADNDLHAFGRFYIKQMLVGLLTNRAKLEA